MAENGTNRLYRPPIFTNYPAFCGKPLQSAESDYFDCISQYINHIAVAQFGTFACFGLAVQFYNAILDKLIGLRTALAYTQEFYQLVEFDVRLTAIGHGF